MDLYCLTHNMYEFKVFQGFGFAMLSAQYVLALEAHLKGLDLQLATCINLFFRDQQVFYTGCSKFLNLQCLKGFEFAKNLVSQCLNGFGFQNFFKVLSLQCINGFEFTVLQRF